MTNDDFGKIGNKNNTNAKNIALVIMSIALVLTIALYFVAPYKGNNDTNSTINCTSLENKAYITGAEYGMNYSINSLLYYAQNCQIVNVNYTNKVYSFVDVSCINNNRTK